MPTLPINLGINPSPGTVQPNPPIGWTTKNTNTDIFGRQQLTFDSVSSNILSDSPYIQVGNKSDAVYTTASQVTLT